MKISKDSWHFKIAKFFDPDIVYKIERNNISDCEYIRSFFMYFILFLVFLAVGVAAIIGLLMAYVVLPIWMLFDVEALNMGPNAVGILKNSLPIAIFTYIGSGLILCVFIKDKIKNHNSDKPDGIIKSYFKAKKDKICSRVEFVEGEK